MRKKIAVYAITALLMGFAVMLPPLAFQKEPPAFMPPVPQEMRILPDGANEVKDSTPSTFGPASQPSNLLPSSLILLTGLIVALSAYIFSKKQLKRQ